VRYAKLLSSLEGKYGSPAKRGTDTLEDCTEVVAECFKRGRAKTYASWLWQNGLTIDLTLNGGVDGARPELSIVYRRPPGAPKADAL
jgi:hypothetical protein